MTITVTPTPRDRFGMTAIKYATPGYHGSVVFNRKGEFVGLSLAVYWDRSVAWLDDPEGLLPPGLLDAARAAYRGH